MVRFIRGVRRKLFEERRLRQYLPYAVGEVLLVVVGILIALQINNWNEWRKSKKLEIEILSEIRENLIQDRVDHDQNMRNFNIIIKSADIILDHLDQDRPYHDSLAYYFSWVAVGGANFDPVKSGYQLLISKGVQLISNDSLRIEISTLYERDYAWLRDMLKDNAYLFTDLLFENIMQKFQTFDWTRSAVPKDFEALKNDDTFNLLIQQQRSTMQYTRRNYERLYQQSESIIGRIDRELN